MALPLRAPTMATIGMSATLDVEQRRRRIDLGKRRRKAWLSDGDQARAKTLGRRELGLCLFLATETDVVNASAKARQHRCRIDGGLCATELVDRSQGLHSRS